MDVNLMREALHSAVDRIIDEYLVAGSPSSPPSGQLVPTVDVPLVVRGGETGPWSFRRPGTEGTEKFYKSQQYEVGTPYKTHRVRLAWSERPAWGRRDRKRAIVFGQTGSASSAAFYPWTEFVETDTARHAAANPEPRAAQEDADILRPAATPIPRRPGRAY